MKNSILKEADHLDLVDLEVPYGFNLLYVDRNVPLQQSINLICKRSFDLIASAILLVCLFSWICPILALVIRYDSRGPVFFLQKRNKRNGKLFTCFKFRTMVVNNEADVLPATENDFRITRIGLFLRKHHLDELPQLLNVFWGDMSLVGPRPYMVSDNEKYEKLIKNYLVRQKIKPGLTGLAQVINHVNNLNRIEFMKERVDRDLFYVYNWSFSLDAKILFRTFLKMLRVK